MEWSIWRKFNEKCSDSVKNGIKDNDYKRPIMLPCFEFNYPGIVLLILLLIVEIVLGGGAQLYTAIKEFGFWRVSSSVVVMGIMCLMIPTCFARLFLSKIIKISPLQNNILKVGLSVFGAVILLVPFYLLFLTNFSFINTFTSLEIFRNPIGYIYEYLKYALEMKMSIGLLPVYLSKRWIIVLISNVYADIAFFGTITLLGLMTEVKEK